MPNFFSKKYFLSKELAILQTFFRYVHWAARSCQWRHKQRSL